MLAWLRLHAETLLVKFEVIEATQLQKEGDSRIGHITEAMGPEHGHAKCSISRREKLQQLVQQKDWPHLSQEQESK